MAIVKLSASILSSISPADVPKEPADATPLVAKRQPAVQIRALVGDDPPAGKGYPSSCMTAFALHERQVRVVRRPSL